MKQIETTDDVIKSIPMFKEMDTILVAKALKALLEDNPVMVPILDLRLRPYIQLAKNGKL